MKKTVWLMAIALAAAVVFTACDDGSGGGTPPVGWGTWVDASSTAKVNMTPTADKQGCDVTVTGTANTPDWNNWKADVRYNYTATVGKTYKVSWTWKADSTPFQNVTIQYIQQKDYQNGEAYQFGTGTNMLTIPTTEETKEYTFTMLANCLTHFTFMIGADTGSFTISDFKVEEQAASGNGDDITVGSWTWSAWGDQNDNGTSTAAVSESSGAITISGNITNAYQYGYAGCSAEPNATELAKLKTATSISFKVKGDGKKYKVVLPTSNITDYSYYYYQFTAPTTETTITVNLQGSGPNSLSKPSWGQGNFDQSKITGINWENNIDLNTQGGTFSLTISDLTLNQN